MTKIQGSRLRWDTVAVVLELVIIGIACLVTAYITGRWWLRGEYGADLSTVCGISLPLGLCGLLFICVGVTLIFRK